MRKLSRLIEDVRDFVRWIRRRDSDSAAIMIIIVSNDLNKKDLRQMRDYLVSLELHNDSRSP